MTSLRGRLINTSLSKSPEATFKVGIPYKIFRHEVLCNSVGIVVQCYCSRNLDDLSNSSLNQLICFLAFGRSFNSAKCLKICFNSPFAHSNLFSVKVEPKTYGFCFE